MDNKNNGQINMELYGECENLPNAAKLIQSLRYLDYDNISAINDLIDNSIDAGASHIWVEIISGAKSEVEAIEIWDDGYGMDYGTLDEALKLGSETGRNSSSDLGLYGMGLITASISMGEKLEVYTKRKNTELLIGIQDLKEIQEKNRFVKTLKHATDEEYSDLARSFTDKFKSIGKAAYLPESFTRVKVSHLDRIQWARSSSMTDNLKKKIGQVFRKFIQAEKCRFYINGIPVQAIDPIYDLEPTILFEDDVELDEGRIRIVIAAAKDYGTEINKEKELNIPNQGFYLMRNNRQIAGGETLNLFTKHNDYNLLRIELSYPGTLDTILNTNFTKQKVRLNQSTEHKILAVCQPFIRQVRIKAKEAQAARREKTENFDEIEKYITQKSQLLKSPKVLIEERKPGEEREPHIRKEPDVSKVRVNLTKKRVIDIAALKVRFDQLHLGDKGPLWEPDQEREKVIVRWNIDHPFYQQVVSPNSDTPEVFNPLVYLIYTVAVAELIAKEGSDAQEILDNIRWDVGRNLAILLK